MQQRRSRWGLMFSLALASASLTPLAAAQDTEVPRTPDGHPDYRPPPFPSKATPAPPAPPDPELPSPGRPQVVVPEVPPVPPPPPEPWKPDYSASLVPLFRLGFTTDRLLPERASFDQAWNFGLDSELGAQIPFADSGLGILVLLRLGLGYGTDDNFGVDGGMGLGLALNLGPVTIAPVGAIGGTSRAGGDRDRSYRVDGDAYGQIGGRLRFGMEGFGFDASVARNIFFGLAEPFENPDDPFFDDPFFDDPFFEDPEPTSLVAHQTRVDLRLFVSEPDALREYFIGGYWTRHGGAAGYSDADQFGGTIGIAWAQQALFDAF